MANKTDSKLISNSGRILAIYNLRRYADRPLEEITANSKGTPKGALISVTFSS